jgi:glycosyltransferase involved in cell wall biosynthesis
VRVAFVYPNPRRALEAEVAAGNAPDTGLLGQNHLAEFGIDARTVEPSLRRRERAAGALHRWTWNARELTLPWELGDAEVAVTPLANLFPLSARARGRPRVVLLSYGITTVWQRASRLRRRLFAVSLRACEAVACLGIEQRDALVTAAGLEPSRVRVVPIGVDERYFRPSPLPDDGYVLSVGKDLARDYGTLARAAAGLDAKVVVVGHPRNLAGIPLPPHLEVRTGVSWAELRRLYAGAACVVLPLRRPEYRLGTEGSGLTALLEAMACGRPVVASDRAVLRDYARSGESCIFVPPEDPAALRQGVESVLGDRPLAERLGARGRELVEEQFTSPALAARLAALLREVGAEGDRR